MNTKTGNLIADVIAIHILDPESPPNRPVCLCGAEPLDGFPQHVARMVQHAIAGQDGGTLSDIKLRILARDFTYEELRNFAVQGVDAFDLLRAMVTEDVAAYDGRAASNGTLPQAEESMAK